MTKPAESLAAQVWNRELQPARAVCELFDYLEDVQFWIKDRTGHYRWVNVACLLNYGLGRRDEMVGKTDDDLSPAHIAAQFRSDDELVLGGKTVVNRIELVGRFDHTARWCVTFKLPLRDGKGEIIATAGITRPVKSGGDDWEGMPLGKTVGYIAEHYCEPLPNGQLARMAGLSERAFERQFRRHYGLSPQQYIKRLRVRTACHALVHTDRSIAVIAVEHGFADQSYFTREFRELVGATPRAYRQSFRESSA
jgi:AraC-like DNA-binding protein